MPIRIYWDIVESINLEGKLVSVPGSTWSGFRRFIVTKRGSIYPHLIFYGVEKRVYTDGNFRFREINDPDPKVYIYIQTMVVKWSEDVESSLD